MVGEMDKTLDLGERALAEWFWNTATRPDQPPPPPRGLLRRAWSLRALRRAVEGSACVRDRRPQPRGADARHGGTRAGPAGRPARGGLSASRTKPFVLVNELGRKPLVLLNYSSLAYCESVRPRDSARRRSQRCSICPRVTRSACLGTSRAPTSSSWTFWPATSATLRRSSHASGGCRVGNRLDEMVDLRTPRHGARRDRPRRGKHGVCRRMGTAVSITRRTRRRKYEARAGHPRRGPGEVGTQSGGAGRAPAEHGDRRRADRASRALERTCGSAQSAARARRRRDRRARLRRGCRAPSRLRRHTRSRARGPAPRGRAGQRGACPWA